MCIRNNKYLLSIIKNNSESGNNICSEIIYGNEITALELIITTCKNQGKKNIAIKIEKDMKSEDFVL